jgi:streptogramin lyase
LVAPFLAAAISLAGALVGPAPGAVTALADAPGSSGCYAAPAYLTPGPGGNVYFGAVGDAGAGSITSAGTVTLYGVPPAYSPAGVQSMALGPDGNIWFAQPSYISRVNPDGTVRNFGPGGPGNQQRSMWSMTAASDGALWVTKDPNELVRVTTGGAVTTVPVPGASRLTVDAVMSAADGNLWMTASDGATMTIIRMTTAGAGTSFAGPASTEYNHLLIRGFGADLWTVAGNVAAGGGTASHSLVHINLDGTFTSLFLGPDPVNAIALGPDGRVWYGSEGYVGAVDAAGAVTRYPVYAERSYQRGIDPTYSDGAHPSVHGIVTGADGLIWFSTELSLGRMNSSGGDLARFTSSISFPMPRACEVSPASGARAGGQYVTVRGRGLATTNKVMFGNTVAPWFSVVSDEELTVATPPAATTGTVYVSAWDAAGHAWQSAAFDYVDPPSISGLCLPAGRIGGGDHVQVRGTYLRGATAITFGGIPGAILGWFTRYNGVTVESYLEVVTPPHDLGKVDVIVSNGAGSSSPAKTAKFVYAKGPLGTCPTA